MAALLTSLFTRGCACNTVYSLVEGNEESMSFTIRNRRKELKWSRETLSEKTDVSARFLACVENGQSGLSLESLGRMSCALGVSTDFLLFGSGTAPIPNDLADALASIPPDYHDLLVKQVRLFSDIIK